jgi:adenine phosphoribosyltransferase
VPTIEEITAKIRDIPDFPEKGILFKDITPLLGDAEAFKAAVEEMARPYKDARVDAVVAIEARGYIFGAPLATYLGTGFVPVRKVGKLPFKTYRVEYALEYGSATIEMHEDALLAGHRVLIVDDVLATGGTLAAAAKLVEQTGAQVAGMSVLLEIEFLNGRKNLPGYDLHAVIKT